MINNLSRMGFDYNDIGVISPYSLQVKEIRSMCSCLDIETPKIGTVEEFQGQERKIILVSTVRSNVEATQNDQTYNLGFVQNARRLNVAISRAR